MERDWIRLVLGIIVIVFVSIVITALVTSDKICGKALDRSHNSVDSMTLQRLQVCLEDSHVR